MLCMQSNEATDQGLPRRIGLNLRRRREELGLTQQDLSRRLDGSLSAAHLSRYENGHTMPLAGTLLMLATALECSLDDLVREPAK